MAADVVLIFGNHVLQGLAVRSACVLLCSLACLICPFYSLVRWNGEDERMILLVTCAGGFVTMVVVKSSLLLLIVALDVRLVLSARPARVFSARPPHLLITASFVNASNRIRISIQQVSSCHQAFMRHVHPGEDIQVPSLPVYSVPFHPIPCC
ncbi:hypothetical protein MRB53_041083 [Persea americana]|nr:hypothetical protein MRB53_041083 [Persea americana]